MLSTSVTSEPTSSQTTTVKTLEIDTDKTWSTEQKEVEDDADYDPKEDEAQGVKDQEEDLAESSSDQTGEETPVEQVDEEKEIALDSEEFQKEWNQAIDRVLEIAQVDRKRILSNAKQSYVEETGDEATDEMVHEAFKVFGMDHDAESVEEVEVEEVEEELCDVDPVDFREEFEMALELVRELAQLHQTVLVNKICGISRELTGKEPKLEQLSEIFGRIRGEFAEEAREEFLSYYEATERDEDSDSDYDEDENVQQEVCVNEEEDNDESENEQDEDYSPETDTFDYSQDIEDDQFQSDEDEIEEDERQ